VGAIYLADNHCNSQRTKHIETRRHFVKEWVEDDILKIIFATTLHNTADIFTKNPTEESFRHMLLNWSSLFPTNLNCFISLQPTMRIWFLKMNKLIGLALLKKCKQTNLGRKAQASSLLTKATSIYTKEDLSLYGKRNLYLPANVVE
jgi:hypothetical protein